VVYAMSATDEARKTRLLQIAAMLLHDATREESAVKNAVQTALDLEWEVSRRLGGK
jgi:hypothetical protein